MFEDAELLRRYVDLRSEEAFAELVRRRIGLVYSVALRRTGDASRAEDVTQMVFTDLARKASGLASRPLIAGWLYRSAHFAAATLMRSERNRRARETEAYIMDEITKSDSGDVAWEKARPLLDEVMSELDESDRDAILLRFFDDRSFADVSTRLGLTENGARMRVERALDKFHALLARRGVRSTSAALGVALAQQGFAAVSAPVGLAAAVTGTALLAGGSGASAPVAGLLYFMGAQKIAMGVAGIVVAVGLGVAVSEVRFDREKGMGVAALKDDHSATLARLHALQRRAEEAERRAVERQRELAERRAAESARQTRMVEEFRARREAQLAEGNAFVARHPEVKALAIKNRRMENAGTYAQLFKMLRLTPEQIERFLDLSVQGIGGSLSKGDGQLISDEFGGSATEAKKQLRELLGEDGYRLYEQYPDRVSPAQQDVVQVAGNLYRSGVPLTPEQGERLRRILIEGRVAVEWSSRLQYDWSAIMSPARSVLLPAQWEALSHERAQDEFSQAFTRFRTTASASAGKDK